MVYQYPALQDNFHFIIVCEKTKKCAAVDIYDPYPLFKYIKENDLVFEAIINTHHHMDHSGGNEAILERYPEIKIYGSKYDFENKRIFGQNQVLIEGDEVSVGEITFSILDIPGHTLGHIGLINEKYVFVGDTLFASGCGRLFEGNPSQMVDSLKKLIKNISKTAEIYCGHEYTLANLKFAKKYNEDYFLSYFAEISKIRENGLFTLPTSLERELKYNPFLMAFQTEGRENLGLLGLDDVAAFAKIREEKDNS